MSVGHRTILIWSTVIFLPAIWGAGNVKCFVPEGDDGTFHTKLCMNETTGDFYTVKNDNPEHFDFKIDINTFWLLAMGALVFFMQTGFAMLEAGAVAIKNIQNILYKNLMDASIGALLFYFIGFGFAYGDGNDGPFIGSSNFALVPGYEGVNIDWFFQYTFAATAATIVSGSVAERCKLEAYFIYALFLIAWVYPVVVHWIWDQEGWLFKLGVIDFAGSSCVHLVGGTAGLVGAKILGPRWETFDHNGKPKPKLVPPQETLLQSLGTTFLWFGWYGFNCGSTLGIMGQAKVASRIAVATTLVAASGGITSAILTRVLYGTHQLGLIFNGILAALVSICACASTIEVYMAIPIGIMAAVFYNLASRGLLWFQIDDPLDAAAVHAAGGFWGILCPGIFSSVALIEEGGFNSAHYTSGYQFGIQLCTGVVVFLWALVNSILIFGVMDKTIGIRVGIEIEKEGLDSHEHGGIKMMAEAPKNFRNSSVNLFADLKNPDGSLKFPFRRRKAPFRPQRNSFKSKSKSKSSGNSNFTATTTAITPEIDGESVEMAAGRRKDRIAQDLVEVVEDGKTSG